MSWQAFARESVFADENKLLNKEMERILKAKPQIYWYPCCGSDFMPLVFDVPDNPLNKRIFPLRTQSQKRSILLWMNDYRDRRLFAQTGVVKSDFYEDLQGRLKVDVSIEGTFPFVIKCRDFIYPGRNLVESGLNGEANGNNDQFLISSVLLSVRVSNRNQGRNTRPMRGDVYKVIFSLADARVLLSNVFASFRLPIHTVALVKPGEGGRLYYELPNQLITYSKQIGKLEAYISDQELDFRAFQRTEHFVQGWGSGSGSRFWLRDSKKKRRSVMDSGTPNCDRI